MEQIVARACNTFVDPAGVVEGIGDVSGSVGIAFIAFKILSPWEGADGLASRGESHRGPLVVVAGGGDTGDIVSIGRETGEVAGGGIHIVGEGSPRSSFGGLIFYFPSCAVVGLPGQGGGVGAEVGGLQCQGTFARGSRVLVDEHSNLVLAAAPSSRNFRRTWIQVRAILSLV